MRPIISIIIVIIASAIISQVIYILLNKGLKKYYCHTNTRLEEITQKNTPYDLLLIGSSRVHLSINPAIIDSICNVNSYNAGSEGGKMTVFKMIIDGYLIHHPAPKTLVLAIDLNSLSRFAIYNYPQYYPFLKNKVVYNTLLDNGYRVDLIKWFPFLGLTDLDDYSKGNAVKGLLGRGGTEIPDGDFEYKGYLSNGEAYIRKEEKRIKPQKVELSDTAISYLHDIIDTCKARDIKLIFVYAPEYNFNLQKRVTNANEILKTITQITYQNNIPFLRDDSTALCKDPKLFANNGHLNKIGARAYSYILGEQLRPFIRQK
jgi:hypothetical protein